MADRVHAAVQPVQSAGPEPEVDASGAETRGQQLRAGDNSVLCLREQRDAPVDRTRVALSFHVDDKATRSAISPPRPDERVALSLHLDDNATRLAPATASPGAPRALGAPAAWAGLAPLARVRPAPGRTSRVVVPCG